MTSYQCAKQPSIYSSDNIDAMVCSVNKLSVSPSQNLIAVPYDNRNVSSRVAKWQIEIAEMESPCPVAWKNTFWSKNECKTFLQKLCIVHR